MNRSVEKREQSDHPPKVDERIPFGQPPHRRDRDGDGQQSKCPDAGVVGDGLDRVDSQVTPERVVDELRQRAETRDEHHGFQYAPNQLDLRHREKEEPRAFVRGV